MNLSPVIWTAVLAVSPAMLRGENLLDQVADKLTFSALNGQVRGRISGLLDLEYYYFTGDAPGMIFTDNHYLFNERLSVFLDAQLGSRFYAFVQARVDQGFDPSDSAIGVRLDEYALRWTPWEDGRLNVQAGQFATIVGTYVERHLSWENPLINAPLIYENVTGIYDARAPRYARRFGQGAANAKYEYNPVIWGPSYASGISFSGKLGKFDAAAEMKNACLSSRPESWGVGERNFENPTFSARLAYHPDMAWTLGISASDGAYFADQAEPSLPPGTGLGDYREKVLGQDISFAWSHWQLWAEVYEARFEVPNVGNADTTGYYLEAKYKFTPSLFGALRWNQQFFGDVSDGYGGEQPWGDDISRVDAAITWRFTPQTQLKVQYSLQHEKEVSPEISHLLAAQFTVRF
jgi:hypothetical protein